ncbi:MAG: signal peptidase I, partial [Anaerolineae bacterium]|nr:signal peptidase I [Anaerolineae bacterium]
MNISVAEVTDALVDARLQSGDAVRFTIPTWSMSPLLTPGDQVLVHRARTNELQIGDVIIIKPDASARWLAHRLIAQRVANGCTYLVTKGDNCVAPDAFWTESQLCGIVTAVWRQGARAPVDWQTRRARWLGALLALVSRVQARAYALPNGRLR